MTATDELRRLLDERGVEYVGTHQAFTAWWGDHDLYWSAMEVYDGELDLGTNMSNVSPEQAIAATLGPCSDSCNCMNGERTGERMTCRPREVRSRFSMTQECVTYHCECGHELGGYMTVELPFPHTYNEDKLPNFCPNCGRRIEVDDG